MTYNINGVDWIHIKELARITHHSAQSIRNLVFHGNKFRPLTAMRDRSRILIAKVELTGYPFPSGNGIVFHYDENGEKQPCPECTAGRKCQARTNADSVFDAVVDAEITRERQIYKENEEDAIY